MLNNGSIIDGTYQIICKIGDLEGSRVYRARHLKQQCDVIVRQLGKGAVGSKISNEVVLLLKSMSSEHLPVIYDVLSCEGDIYSIEEEKKGILLDTYVRQRGRLTYAQAYAFVMQLVDVLVYLHGEIRITHANILPQNIVIEPDGEMLWLTNMDIGRALGFTEYSSGGEVSLGFLAPEQYLIAVEHQAARLTSATDIYCAGCVIYYMLTGYAPDTRYDQVIPIRSLKLDVEQGFQQIIEKMMEYQPNDRFHDAMELRHEIDECYKLDKRYRKIRRRRRSCMIMATLFLLAGIGMIAGGIYKNRLDDRTYYTDRLNAADDCVLKKEYYDARDIIMDLENDYPESLELYYREILCMYRAKDYEDCIARAQMIMKDHFPREFSDEDDCPLGDFYHVLAQSCYRIEEYEDAQEYIERALEYYDQNYEYYRDYCLILVAQGKVDKAEGELGVSEDLEWDELDHIYVEAKIAFALEDYASAAEKYLRVIDDSEDDEIVRDAYISCAASYDSMRDYGDEAAILQRAILVYSEDNFYSLQLAGTYMAWGDEEEYSSKEYYTKALQLYEELMDQLPDDFEVRDHITELYFKLGDYTAAEKLLLDMPDTFRNQYRVYMWLSYIEDEKQGQLKKKKRDYHQMQKYYEKARSLYSSSLEDYDMEDLEERMAQLKEEGWFKS